MLHALLDFLFPRQCLSCGSRRTGEFPGHCCESCRGAFEKIPPPFCEVCGGFIEGPEGQRPLFSCGNCLNPQPLLTLARAAWVYRPETPVSKLILSLKHLGVKDLGRELTEFAFQDFPQRLPWEKAAAVIPVPLHPRRLRKREYNQSALIARQVSRLTDLPHLPHLLKRVRDTPAQQGGAQRRAENVAGAFALARRTKVPEGTVVLVDDVCTTGATLRECARVLKAAGVPEVWAFTLARPPAPAL